MNRDQEKHILVTGATSGIGREVMILLAGKGYRVHGVSRRGRPESWQHGSAAFYPMDVSDPDSIEQTLAAICGTQEGLSSFHAVIHCAGYGIAGSTLDTPIEAVREQFETNYFGVLRINEALLRRNLLSKSRIIVIGSVAGRISIPYQGHYSATKFALEAYVEALRLETRHLGMTAVIIEPGDTKTSFTSMRTYHAPEGSPFEERGRKAVQKMAKDEQNGHHPRLVAKTVYRALKRRNPPVRVTVGLSYTTLMLLKRVLPDRLAEYIVRLLYLS